MSGSGLVIREVQGVKVVTMHLASLQEGPQLDAIAKALYALVDEQAHRQIILDFRAVTFMASKMLGILISLHQKAQAIDGKVVLCGIREKLMEVFKVMALDKMLDIVADETAAMKAFGIASS